MIVDFWLRNTADVTEGKKTDYKQEQLRCFLSWSEDPTTSERSREQILGNSWKEELTFNRKRPPVEPGSARQSHLPWLVGEKKEKGQKSTQKHLTQKAPQQFKQSAALLRDSSGSPDPVLIVTYTKEKFKIRVIEGMVSFSWIRTRTKFYKREVW